MKQIIKQEESITKYIKKIIEQCYPCKNIDLSLLEKPSKLNIIITTIDNQTTLHFESSDIEITKKLPKEKKITGTIDYEEIKGIICILAAQRWIEAKYDKCEEVDRSELELEFGIDWRVKERINFSCNNIKLKIYLEKTEDMKEKYIIPLFNDQEIDDKLKEAIKKTIKINNNNSGKRLSLTRPTQK